MASSIKFYWLMVFCIEIPIVGIIMCVILILLNLGYLGVIVFAASIILPVVLSIKSNRSMKKLTIKEASESFDGIYKDNFQFEWKVNKFLAGGITGIVFGIVILSFMIEEHPIIGVSVLIISLIFPIICGIFLTKSSGKFKNIAA